MGPYDLSQVLSMSLNGPIYFLLQVLPITVNGPTIFTAGASNKFEWTHYLLSQMLPMTLNGPSYFYGRYCQ